MKLSIAEIPGLGLTLDAVASVRSVKVMSTSVHTVLVIDDVRTFGFTAVYARTAAAGIARLARRDARFEELWLDHDLGPGGDVRRVVKYLERRAFEGRPVPIGRIFVQSDNPAGAAWIVAGLARWYPTSRAPTRALD